jgi:hypothetical protein
MSFHLVPFNADQIVADRCPFCGSVFRDQHECHDERLRAQVEALPGNESRPSMWIRRDDVLALLDGESDG